MLDDHNGQTARREFSDQRHRLIDFGVIEPGHDFVEQQQPRFGRKRPRHLQPTLIYRGEVARRGMLLGGKSDEVDCVAGA
jgi:hypothetical protein